ncbi:MAG: hypothetical protein KatS3mg059_0680 [Thermomicrobiales bacterium]|nr:MAG: hypothetical protein KatS3mg059_0680 [Thermomicrobiales bacterium]
MIRCPDCSTENPDDARFCINCGRDLRSAAATLETPAQSSQAPGKPVGEVLADDGLPVGEDVDGTPGGERILWEGRPGWPLAWWSAITNRYRVTTERLIQERGFIRKTTEQIDLYRIEDVDMRQGLIERLLGMGDIGLSTADATAPRIELHDVRDPNRIKDLIWKAARIERQRRRVLIREEL